MSYFYDRYLAIIFFYPSILVDLVLNESGSLTVSGSKKNRARIKQIVNFLDSYPDMIELTLALLEIRAQKGEIDVDKIVECLKTLSAEDRSKLILKLL